MKHTPQQYAEALYDVLQHAEGKHSKQIIRNFLVVLQKNKDSRLLNRILTHYEKVFLKKRGLKKVEVESVAPLSDEIRKDIEHSVGGKILFHEKINPDLLGGMTIIIDDSVLIDASIKKRITCLLS